MVPVLCQISETVSVDGGGTAHGGGVGVIGVGVTGVGVIAVGVGVAAVGVGVIADATPGSSASSRAAHSAALPRRAAVRTRPRDAERFSAPGACLAG